MPTKRKVVRIYSDDNRHNLVSVRAADTLKGALQDFYRETLVPKAIYSKPVIRVNKLTVTWKFGKRKWVAEFV